MTRNYSLAHDDPHLVKHFSVHVHGAISLACQTHDAYLNYLLQQYASDYLLELYHRGVCSARNQMLVQCARCDGPCACSTYSWIPSAGLRHSSGRSRKSTLSFCVVQMTSRMSAVGPGWICPDEGGSGMMFYCTTRASRIIGYMVLVETTKGTHLE